MRTVWATAVAAVATAIGMTGPAAAQCVPLNATTVQCLGEDLDGVAILPPTSDVVVQGKVVGTRAIDARLAPNVDVVNSGEISGTTAAIDSTSGLDLQNSGDVTGLGNDAVRAETSGTINNLSGTITAIGGGSAITGTSGLKVTNTSGDIESQAGGPAIEAGANGTVTNQAGGQITSTTDAAIAGTSGLIVDNDATSDVSSLLDVAIDAGINAEVTNFGAVTGTGALSYGVNGALTNHGEIENRVGPASVAAVDGTLDLEIDNKATGDIDGRFGAAVSVDSGSGAEIDNAGEITSESTSRATIALDLDGTADLRNTATGEISNSQGDGIASEGGQLQIRNDGNIAAAGTGIVQHDGDLALTNAQTGTISGDIALAFESGHDGSREIDNAGRLEGSSGTAVNVASDAGRTAMTLREQSAIFGDVFFGGGDDTLTLLDLSSTLLSTGTFDGQAGKDLLIFGPDYEEDDITAFEMLDATTFRVKFLVSDGDMLSGRWLATGGGATVCLWDCSGKGPSGRKPRQYDAHTNKLTQLVFQPDGKLLASADADAFLFLWDPIKHDKIVGGVSLSSSASCLRWCKGDKLAVGQQDGKVVIFKVQSEASDESRSVISKLNPFV